MATSLTVRALLLELRVLADLLDVLLHRLLELRVLHHRPHARLVRVRVRARVRVKVRVRVRVSSQG